MKMQFSTEQVKACKISAISTIQLLEKKADVMHPHTFQELWALSLDDLAHLQAWALDTYNKSRTQTFF
jgi:hypothetical protein